MITESSLFNARIYKLHKKQKEIYDDKSRFKVVVAGRRFGKCLAENTLIQMCDGSFKKIQEIQEGDLVTTLNEDTYLFETKPVKHVMDNGVKSTLRIKTKYGREIISTPNHPFLCDNQWINAENLKVGNLFFYF